MALRWIEIYQRFVVGLLLKYLICIMHLKTLRYQKFGKKINIIIILYFGKLYYIKKI